jgi:hypothetical protein
MQLTTTPAPGSTFPRLDGFSAVLLLVLAVQCAVSDLAAATQPITGALANRNHAGVTRWTVGEMMTWATARSVSS